jgi:cellulose synthase/poly-beta-1,6-N-acetylglucosamine synthase-like glycosyltransferase
LIANMALKLTTAILFLHRGAMGSFKYKRRVTDAPLPKISIMVPLFKESAIMSHLLANLRQLDYPKTLLQVILVMERDDITTAKTLAHTRLPPWITAINVPGGTIKTKPRALNYALDNCKGSIIGVYDAEDAPEPGQVRKVARHFAQGDEKLACVRGTLNFYNARTENATAGPGPLAIFWRAIALRGYAVTIFIVAFTLDLLAGLSRPAPSLNGLHAKLGFLHIGRDLLNV